MMGGIDKQENDPFYKEIEDIVKSAGDGFNSWDDVPPVTEDQEYIRISDEKSKRKSKSLHKQ